jgi:hypothetical protein
MSSEMRAELARMHIQDLLREAENGPLLASGDQPPTLVGMLRVARLLGRLGTSAWNLALGRFHRRHEETELAEGIVDRWLNRARSAGGESEGMQEGA